LDGYLRTPGRFAQSANESSFDEWIQPEGDRHQNASVSIYPKGEMLGLAMDLTLRKESAGKLGLVDVHRLLWQKHRVDQGGYSEADVLAALQQVSGRSWQDFWNRYVIGTEELPVLALLQEAGIDWLADKKPEDGKPYYWTGLSLGAGSDTEFAVVKAVEKGSPAWNAGITAGDIIAAVNGFRVSAKSADARFQSFGDRQMSLSIFRREQAQSVKLNAEQKAGAAMKLEADSKATPAQLALRKAWLGR
jgi:predicted metalloprotease with PDZ domain